MLSNSIMILFEMMGVLGFFEEEEKQEYQDE